MAHSGYDAVVAIDDEGDLGYTDLRDDLEFHTSTFSEAAPHGLQGGGRNKPAAEGLLPLPATASRPSPLQFWTLPFYAQFFDVDTTTVLSRSWAALFPRDNFLDVLEGNPDLYGPFWIATTVILLLFLGGTINQFVTAGSDDGSYDFRLLTASAGLVYGYTILIPVGLYAALRYFGSDTANVLECWALYGYANLVWIPVALISWSPVNILNWVFVAAGFGLSVAFLLRNLYPVLSATDRQVSKALLVVVVVLHAALALAIKILCFAHGGLIVAGKADAE